MTRPARVARQTPVSACQGLLAIEPLLVRADELLLTVARRAARQPATRVIGVVDESGRLIGILPILRVLENVVARVDPASLMGGLGTVEDVARFGQSIEDTTAADAMLPPISISTEATVGEAFRLMHRHHVSGIYVVGADDIPTDYLDLLELVLLYADALEQRSPGPPSGPPAS